jgi:hypothetical protein
MNSTIVKNFIQKNINKPNIFDEIILDIHNYNNTLNAYNMKDLKIKLNDKKIKGDLWEAFCYLYLKNILEHNDVWLYNDIPENVKNDLHLTKKDFGIDIVSKKNNDYFAIQCKYKKPSEKTQIVSWRALSTFYGIVTKTGPWKKHIIMTNVNGCAHIGKKTEFDKSICIKTFQSIKYFEWLKMAELDSMNVIINDNLNVIINDNIKKDKIINDKEEIRLKRLEFYEKMDK